MLVRCWLGVGDVMVMFWQCVGDVLVMCLWNLLCGCVGDRLAMRWCSIGFPCWVGKRGGRGSMNPK